MGNLNCKKPNPCVPDTKPKEIYPLPTASFSQCVGDYVWSWDGTRLTRERIRTTPDGTYSSVTLVDGCVVEYGHCPEPVYTPPYCNPNPAPCQTPTGGLSGSISTGVDNALVQKSDGLFARAYLNGSDSVTITGVGTLSNPYVIKFTAPNIGSREVVATKGLVSNTTADGVTYVGMEQVNSEGVYDITDQFTVDSYGRIISVDKRDEPLIGAGAGLETNNQGNTVFLAHPTYNTADSVVVGGWTVSLNNSGHITATARSITLQAGTYNIGAYNVGLNEFGSVTSIVQRDDVLPSSGTFRTADGKILSYDITGRLTGVVDTTSDNNNKVVAIPAPIRDMYKIKVTSYASNSIEKDEFGVPLNAIASNGSVRITLPSYVLTRTQVEVNGAAAWSIDAVTSVLSVTVSENTPFTVTLRS